MANTSANFTFGYTGTDFKHGYSFSVADSIAAAPDDIANAIKAINASLAGGTAGGLDEFFLADDFDGTNGKFASITAASIDEDTIEQIYPTVQGGI